MFTRRQTNLEKALVSIATVLLLLTTIGQCAGALTTAAPTASNPSLSNSSTEEPKIQFSQRPCGSKHSAYCFHDGTCIYPQDSTKPYCICSDSYRGMRCQTPTLKISGEANIEQVIGVIFGVGLVVIILAIVIACFAYKMCVKSTPLIKSTPLMTSV